MLLKCLTWSTVGTTLVFVILSLFLVCGWNRPLGEADPNPAQVEDLLKRARGVAEFTTEADRIESAAKALQQTNDAKSRFDQRRKLLDDLGNLVIKADVRVRYLAQRSQRYDVDAKESPDDQSLQQRAADAKQTLAESRDLHSTLAGTVKELRATWLRDILLYVNYVMVGLSVMSAIWILVVSVLSTDA